MQCRTCKWYKWDQDNHDRGDCHYDIPQVVCGSHSGTMYTFFPSPKPTDFCSHHEYKGDDRPKYKNKD